MDYGYLMCTVLHSPRAKSYIPMIDGSLQTRLASFTFHLQAAAKHVSLSYHLFLHLTKNIFLINV